ncbi:hypothetical protein [Mycobacterium colombiense]|nr:hypothetical protein [Mycobacterium colombiense]
MEIATRGSNDELTGAHRPNIIAMPRPDSPPRRRTTADLRPTRNEE